MDQQNAIFQNDKLKLTNNSKTKNLEAYFRNYNSNMNLEFIKTLIMERLLQYRYHVEKY